MKFWQSLFLTEADQLLETVKICEEVGFDGVMLSDHLLHFEQMESSYPYSPDGRPSFSAETIWPECWSTIAALAAVTERIRFVTNVYVLPLRNPIEVAKATSTTASFCEGRLVLGAGAGWMKEEFDLLGITAFSMGAGTLILVVAALVFEGVSSVPPSGWGIIAWLGVVNTALAFFLWNHALQRLEAFETSILQNTMLIQIAVLSWVFLGERLTGMKLVAMAMVFFGVLTVQLRR